MPRGWQNRFLPFGRGLVDKAAFGKRVIRPSVAAALLILHTCFKEYEETGD